MRDILAGTWLVLTIIAVFSPEAFGRWLGKIYLGAFEVILKGILS